MRSSLWLMLGCLLGLVACSGGDKSKLPNGSPVSCPQVAVVRALEQMRDYGTEQPDAKALVAEAKMGEIVGSCAVTDQGIDVRFEVTMQALRGPRLGGHHVSFPFFVAVVSADGKVISKEPMTADFDFAEAKPAAIHTEKLHVMLPTPNFSGHVVAEPRVLLGWQVSLQR